MSQLILFFFISYFIYFVIHAVFCFFIFFHLQSYSETKTSCYLFTIELTYTFSIL